MLKYTCEKCGKEFTSETDYEQHLLFEDQKDMLAKYAEKNTAIFTTIFSQLMILSVLKILDMYSLDKDYDQAIKINIAIGEAWNKVWSERNKIIGNI